MEKTRNKLSASPIGNGGVTEIKEAKEKKAKKTFGEVMLPVAKAVRIITVAPIMALAALTSFFFFCDAVQMTVADYIVSVLCLAVLPVLAYPLQRFIPGFAGKGRVAQRTLAMIFANIGYIAGIIYAIIAGVRGALLALFLSYLLSGFVLIIMNKVFHFKASGHACGVVGPAVASIWYFGAAPAIVIIWAALSVAMIWSSLLMKRHTVSQLIVGALVSSLAVVLWVFVLSII